MRFLPYLHPVWQTAVLALALWTLSLGLRMRARRRGRPGELRASLLERHARAGLTFVAALLVGYAGGPATLGLVRDEPVFSSAHAFFATLTLLLIAFGAAVGLRLWRGSSAVRDRELHRDLHVFCMGLGLFLIFVTVMLGLGLLP